MNEIIYTDPFSGIQKNVSIFPTGINEKETNTMVQFLQEELQARGIIDSLFNRYVTTRELQKGVSQIGRSTLKKDIAIVSEGNKTSEKKILFILEKMGYIHKQKIQNNVYISIGRNESPILSYIENDLKKLLSSHPYFGFQFEKLKNIPLDQEIKLVISIDRDDEGFFIKDISFQTY